MIQLAQVHFRMNSTIDNESTDENWMKFAFKAYHWSKNENAHQKMRERNKNCRKLCVICMGAQMSSYGFYTCLWYKGSKKVKTSNIAQDKDV